MPDILFRRLLLSRNLGNFTVKREIRYQTVLVEGRRTPFSKHATDLFHWRARDLLGMTAESIIAKTGIDSDRLDFCVLGNGFELEKYSNPARITTCVIPSLRQVPATTINSACISSLVAATIAHDKIVSGRYRSVLSGGFDFASNHPFKVSKSHFDSLFPKVMRAPIFSFFLLAARYLFLAHSFKGTPVQDFSTNRSMVNECELMCRMNGISREDADNYAMESHRRALAAQESGYLSDVLPMYPVEGHSRVPLKDNNIRKPEEEKFKNLLTISDINLVKANPDRRSGWLRTMEGTVTAAQSTTLTDGVAMNLFMSEQFANSLNLKPKAFVRGYQHSSHSPNAQFLLGSAYSIPRLLAKHKLTYEDIDFFEIHEAFAGQFLSVMKSLNDPSFLVEKAGVTAELGSLSIDKVNVWGGSIAFGHPFAATGARMINMASAQLHHYKKRYAVISSCAMSGQSVSVLLEACN